ADLVEQACFEALPGHLSTVDDDVLVAGQGPRASYGRLDAVGDENEVVVVLRPVMGTLMGENNRGDVDRVASAPGVGEIVEVPADDQRADVLPLRFDQRSARRRDPGRRYVRAGRGKLDLAVAVPLEQQVETA